MRRILNGLIIFSAIISIPAMILLLAAGWEILFAPPVVEYKNVPFPVANQMIVAGDPLHVVVTRCANDPFSEKPISYTFRRDLVNVETGIKILLPEGSISVNSGCETVLSTLSIISPTVQPGHYFLEGTSTARGLFKTTTAAWQTDTFEVFSGSHA
jgi:hypothetical protein